MVRERLGKTKEACQHIFENFALIMSQWRRTVSSSSRWTLGVRPRPSVLIFTLFDMLSIRSGRELPR
jgi:hypothetical protein